MGRPIDARGWLFEVEDDSTATPAWLPLEKINSWTLNRSENEEVAPTVTNESNGLYEQDIMQRGATLQVSGLYAATAGVQDPGQAFVDTVWLDKLGEESRGRLRYRHQSQDAWTVWECTVSPGEMGGEHNAKTSWGATFTRCGAASTEAVV